MLCLTQQLPADSVSADPCSEAVRWQLLSEAKHSSGHMNFAGRRSLENLYAINLSTMKHSEDRSQDHQVKYRCAKQNLE